MKLELLALKRWVTRASVSREEAVFVVIDSDKAEKYPANFVCLLPKSFESGSKSSSKFLEIYGQKSHQIAINLLTNALGCESDPEVKSEIEKRLKTNQPKPIIKAKCIYCGCVFEPKKSGRFVQRICQTCKIKNKNDH